MLVPITKPKTGVFRYLEDFKIGETIETEAFSLDRDMIVSFAEQYDPQDMHIDEELAKNTIFGELVGSGWQTLLITLKLILNSKRFGDTPLIGAGFKEVRFHHPMYPGDSLKVCAEIMDIRPSKNKADRGLLDIHVTTKTTTGTVLITQTWTLALPTKASVTAAAASH
ncbi:MaoC/PaaZ C-terminal domain-containing protein [Paenalcaligenes sp. Me52]|uniref:MaoC/PaaZ C-terminal domain-containing protein n=1 Tax=Paenalcaligenes sp. Me52 TaxID=3392038 RepID=UPI003D27A49C